MTKIRVWPTNRHARRLVPKRKSGRVQMDGIELINCALVVIISCGIVALQSGGARCSCACVVGLASAVQGTYIGCAFVCCWARGLGAAGCGCLGCHCAWVAIGVCGACAVATFGLSWGRPGKGWGWAVLGRWCTCIWAACGWLKLWLAGRLRIPTQLGRDDHLGGHGGALLSQQPTVKYRTPCALSRAHL